MPAGRKPQGIEQVERLPGSTVAKQRLEVFLANMAGRISVAEACAQLGLHESRFFELRKRWLEESVEWLEPQAPGRAVGTGGAPDSVAREGPGPTPDPSPGEPAGASQRRIAELQEQVEQLQWELRTAQLREELATLGLSRSKVTLPAPKKKEL